MAPTELRYTAEHEWVRDNGDGTFTFGITDHAQDALGDIVFTSLPAVGQTVSSGEACGEVESTKSVSDIYSPMSGTVVAVNESLDAQPEVINQEPYSGGWMVRLQASDPGAFGALLDAAAYEALISTQ